MNARGPPPPPPPPGAMPGQQQQQQQQQQQAAQRQFMPSQPFYSSNTRVVDITPPVTLTDESCRRQLTTYEVQTVRKLDPIIVQDFQEKKKDEDTRKQKKRSKSPSRPKQNWLRVAISVETYEQDTILKKIKTLDKKRPITDKKAALPPHMNSHVNGVLDEKIHSEHDNAFTWSLCQLDRVTMTNKKTKKKETETLILFLKRSPRQEVDVRTVYRNIERAKMQPPPQQQFQHPQGQPQNGQFPPQPRGPPQGQQQRAPPQGPQQKAPSQGPQPRGPAQGPPRQQPNNPPGRNGPPAVEIIHDGPRNGAKSGPKGRDDDVIHVIERGGPNRKVGGKSTYNKRKGVHYQSDDSSSSRSSRSRSDSDSSSDSGSAYSDTESENTSISRSSLNRRRRDSGYARSKGKGTRQHEKGFCMVNKPRRHSTTSYAPDPPPRPRAISFERLSHDPIEVEHRISEAKAEGFAAGFTTASRVSAVDRTSSLPQRTIAYKDDISQRSSLRSIDEDIHTLDDTREAALRLDKLRLQDDYRLREDMRLREEVANARLRNDARRFSDLPTREEIRLRTDFRRGQDTLRLDELPPPQMREPNHFRRGSLSPLSYDPLPPPRGRDYEYLRRGPLSPLPLEPDMPFQYVRNPFIPRRRETEYVD